MFWLFIFGVIFLAGFVLEGWLNAMDEANIVERRMRDDR